MGAKELLNEHLFLLILRLKWLPEVLSLPVCPAGPAAGSHAIALFSSTLAQYALTEAGGL
jgi:hypothetical protein